MSARIDATVLRTLPELEAIADDWHSLAASQGAGPSVQPWFAVAWWRHLGRGELMVHALRDAQGRLVGVAPLHERRVAGLRVVRWLGHGLGAVSEVLGAGDEEDDPIAMAVWEPLAADRRRLLQLVEHRFGGGGLGVLRRGGAWRSDVVLRDSCPVIDFAGLGSVDELLAQRGFRKLRQNLARLDRHIASAPVKVEVELLHTVDELDTVLPELVEVHDRAEDDHERLHFLRPPYREFTVEALHDVARRGMLALAVVRVDGQAVGFHVAVRCGSCVSAWLARFDHAAAEFAPGHLMLRAVTEWSIAVGASRLDMQLGGDLYKRRWSTGAYETVGVSAAPASSKVPARAVLDATEAMYRVRARARASRG